MPLSAALMLGVGVADVPAHAEDPVDNTYGYLDHVLQTPDQQGLRVKGWAVDAVASLQLATLTHVNRDDDDEEFAFDGAQDVPTSHRWVSEASLPNGVSLDGAYVRIPVIRVGGRVALATTGSYTYQEGDEVATTDRWAWRSTLLARANATTRARAAVTTGRVTVPFTLTGVAEYASEYRDASTLSGTFTGVSSDGLTITVRVSDLDGTARGAASPATLVRHVETTHAVR